MSTAAPSHPNPRLTTFVGCRGGSWKVLEVRKITGEGLPMTEGLKFGTEKMTDGTADISWTLRGVTSNDRYVTRPEKDQLLAKQEGLGRPEANCAVLIPIRKNAKWWALTQDERAKIFAEKSHHNQIGMDYLPAIARCLYHCRDLSEIQPFDFLTWFEFAEKDTGAFDQLLTRLRATEEWKYVEREVEVRVKR